MANKRVITTVNGADSRGLGMCKWTPLRVASQWGPPLDLLPRPARALLSLLSPALRGPSTSSGVRTGFLYLSVPLWWKGNVGNV